MIDQQLDRRAIRTEVFTQSTTSVDRRSLLNKLGFVAVPAGQVKMGIDQPLECGVEGIRHNEQPQREMIVARPFWIAKQRITNKLFEAFLPNHLRPPQTPGDNHPVTDITYGEALFIIKRINRSSKMSFRLPTELEWCLAAAPYGWIYPLGNEASSELYHTFADTRDKGRVVAVNDNRYPANYLGLDQMGHNVCDMTADLYQSPGHFGADSDGMYYIAKGGDYGHCINSPRLASRMMHDVADRNPRVGFRLAHDEI